MKRLVIGVVVLALGVVSSLGATALADYHEPPPPPPPVGTHALEAGFAAHTITPIGESPEGWDFWVNPVTGIWSEPFDDADGDGCLGDDESFTDDHRNTAIDPMSAGKWDGIYTNAGFGGRCAHGAFDDTWARAVVVRQAGQTAAMVSLDVVGFFNEEIQRARKEYAEAHPDKPVDAFVVASTHTHEGPDTMGLWGALPQDGKFPLYQAFIRSRIVEAIADAYDALEPATLTYGHALHAKDISDSRPPYVIDPDLWSARFDRADGTTIGTIVNWSNHPEALWSRNPYISSDYPHAVRERMEAEYGGISVFFSGSVGGLMTPRPAPDGQDPYERMLRIGREVAESAIASLEAAAPEVRPALDIAHRVFYIPMDNQSLRALNAAGLFDKDSYIAGVNVGPAGQDVRTEMYAVQLGSGVFVTVPGELFPEIALGTYGRSDCPEADTGRPHEPGIRDQFAEADHHFVLGLGMDELGYIVPGYDFWTTGVDTPSGRSDGSLPPEDPDDLEDWVGGQMGAEFGSGSAATGIGVIQAEDPCGVHHYEETVSASSVMAPMVACVAAELAGEEPWDDPERYPACAPENIDAGVMGINLAGLLR